MGQEGQENSNAILLLGEVSGQKNLRIISLAESEVPGQENPSIILSES